MICSELPGGSRELSGVGLQGLLSPVCRRQVNATPPCPPKAELRPEFQGISHLGASRVIVLIRGQNRDPERNNSPISNNLSASSWLAVLSSAGLDCSWPEQERSPERQQGRQRDRL